ncbi:DUF6544 family protein [Cohaesibacter sp. ES.047]|uniref:DUF6920 family protein n=1 Tax=Cohaesibacter sp. ES.047 TaxID=1798205 RepID=UPI000BB75042|nr:DUF6544 family protein [Cohaesibacter sp. ES.047]
MKILRKTGYVAAAAIVALSVYGYVQMRQTEADIAAFQQTVAEIGAKAQPISFDPDQVAELPEPVRRYFAFSIRGPLPDYKVVRLSEEGDFRRPLTDGFEPTTAKQVIATTTPAMVFSATTPIFLGAWARAYDFYAHGEMEMKAKLLSMITVVDEKQTPELDRISLRRWLLESALYPQALLPGGPVRWEPVDEDSARAIVSVGDMSAKMVAHFDADGRMTSMQAEEDGDLTTPYHGSGEHVARGDYRQVGRMMIPHSFTISRAAKGEIHPFWIGRITAMSFDEK